MAIIGSLGTVVFKVSNNNIFSGSGLGALGSLLGSIGSSGIVYKTPKNYKRSAQARWASHEIIGQKPVSEFAGPGLESISFDMYLDADLGVDPNKELKKLRQMRDNGEKVFLLLGGKPVLSNNSRVYITELSESIERTDRHGRALAIEVSISLQEYAMRAEEMAQNGNNTNQSGTASAN